MFFNNLPAAPEAKPGFASDPSFGETSNINSSAGSPIQADLEDDVRGAAVMQGTAFALRHLVAPLNGVQSGDEVFDSEKPEQAAASALMSLSTPDNKWTPKYGPKKRHRRTNEELSKNHICAIDGCGKAYASAGALKTHMGLKHAAAPPPKKPDKLQRGPRSPRSPR